MTQYHVLFTQTTKNFPARCCPQWTVACEAGSVGCCDPAHPWQRALSLNKMEAIPPASENSLMQTASLTVFALFSSGVASDLNCLTIDSETGRISALKPVKGPAQAYFGKVGLCATGVSFAPSCCPPCPVDRQLALPTAIWRGNTRVSI